MASKIPDLNIPLLEDLYHPDFDPTRLPLNRAPAIEPPNTKEIERKLKEVEARLFSENTPAPLTKEEAAAVELQVDGLQSAIATTRRRIHSIQSKIEKLAVPEGQPEVSFVVDLKKKARLRRAIQKTFGIKPEALTYSMYMAALNAKREIEQSEADDYTSGNWED
jgi:hypothetical protein